MIPEFPKFKKLELSDKNDIEKFTHKFPPYADFNFANMWAWDVHHKIKISQLNKNLVVFFNYYSSGDLFLMFLGEHKLPETATELISYSKKHHQENVLKLIPEEMAHVLERSGFEIKPDRDNFDYVYSVSHLAQMDSWPGSSASKRIKRFIKSCPNYLIKYSSLKDISKDEYTRIFKEWAKNKEFENHFELDEFKAFERFLQVDDKKIEVLSLYAEDILVGLTLYEILPHHCAISHFVKVDPKYHAGVNDILNWEEAKRLQVKGVRYYNWEQDLGIPGLRYSKEKYNPTLFMKKFIVSRK